VSALAALIRADLETAPPAGLEPLLDALLRRHGRALRAVVLYGSTRRKADVHDGLVDLMAVVESYRAVHGRGIAAVLNSLLPPNVYYLEAAAGAGRVRCKYIVVSMRDLARRMRGGLDGYFWARFTQPCRLVHAADPGAIEQVTACRAAAARHFAAQAAPRMRGRHGASAFWTEAVRASYGCELRPEPPGAAEALIGADPRFWHELAGHCLPGLPGVTVEGDAYRFAPGRARRLGARLRWASRRVWSRTLNVLRLFKAAGTFANGVDYLAWKLERHSGIRVEPTERMRRHPRLAAWGLLWRLVRSGALR